MLKFSELVIREPIHDWLHCYFSFGRLVIWVENVQGGIAFLAGLCLGEEAGGELNLDMVTHETGQGKKLLSRYDVCVPEIGYESR